MSDECSSGSSDEECYVNFAARYRKAKKKKIRYKKEEDDTPDYYDKPYEPPKYQQPESNKEEVNAGKRTHLESDSLDLTVEGGLPLEKRSPDVSSVSSNCTNSTTAVEEAISLDSSQDSNCLDSSDYVLLGSPEEAKIEDDNYSVEIKIIWKSKDLIKLDVKRYEPIQKIFKHFAQLEKVPESKILLMKNDKPIKPTDTPVSLDLTIIDVLEGGVVNSSTVHSALRDEDENVCKVKAQSANSKEAVFVKLQRTQDFKAVIYECARKHDVPPEKIKLYFDGELIDSSETPDTLDLEQEACVDLRISN